MSTLQNNRNSSEIQAQLRIINQKMAEHQQRGEYMEAEECRVLSEKLKKQYEDRRFYQMNRRHEHQEEELIKNYEKQLRELTIHWEKTIENHNNEGDHLTNEMELRHRTELEAKTTELEMLLPLKVKESSECLNLRKMEEHMAKQKNFIEAHNLQQKVAAMVAEEKEKWLANRNIKMETALNLLKTKQEVELSNLKKKIKTGLDELIKQRKREEEKTTLRFENTRKEQKMQHDKEKLAEKGHFTSKGGMGSPMLTKTKLFSSRD